MKPDILVLSVVQVATYWTALRIGDYNMFLDLEDRVGPALWSHGVFLSWDPWPV